MALTSTSTLTRRTADRAQPTALYRAAQALQQAVPPQREASPRLWLSGFMAALRACREAVELHERLLNAEGCAAGLASAGVDVHEHLRDHERLRDRIAELVRSARRTPLDDAERLGELRTEGILIAGKLMAHPTRKVDPAIGWAHRAGGGAG